MPTDLKKHAELAIAYARKYVVKGSTQLESKKLPLPEYSILRNAVRAIRDRSKSLSLIQQPIQLTQKESKEGFTPDSLVLTISALLKSLSEIIRTIIRYCLPTGMKIHGHSQDNSAYTRANNPKLFPSQKPIHDPSKETVSKDRNMFILLGKIMLSKRYSLGNCHELALLAYEYFLMKAPHIDAELFRIEGGDHCFVVIGRDKNSLPSAPETWGDKAYFCDPWANKFYHASCYMHEINQYNLPVAYNEHISVPVEIFDSKKHKLELKITESTKDMQLTPLFIKARELLESFLTKKVIISDQLQRLKERLEVLNSRLAEEYGENNPKQRTVTNKIREVQSAFDYVTTNTEHTLWFDARVFSEYLDNQLVLCINRFATAIRTSAEEQEIMRDYTSLKDRVTPMLVRYGLMSSTVGEFNSAVGSAVEVIYQQRMKLFGIAPTTVREFNLAVDKSSQIIAPIKHTF